MNEGWFKIYRCLFKKAIWLNSTPEQKVILITFLGMANHEGKEWEWRGKQFKAEAGQFVASANSIMSKSGIGISRQNVRTALTKFKKYDFLTYESTKTGILVSIVNWGLYQGGKAIVNQSDNPKVINVSPIRNQSLTTNKNDKNFENEKKFIYINEFTRNKLLIETIIDFIKMRSEIKKPMTDRAVQLMLNKLKNLSYEEKIQIKILENSIENCWQGIFPLREDNKEIFSWKEGTNGSFGQDTGTSQKKFNVKIPKWEPNAEWASESSGTCGNGKGNRVDGRSKTSGSDGQATNAGGDGESTDTGGQATERKFGYGQSTNSGGYGNANAKEEPF